MQTFVPISCTQCHNGRYVIPMHVSASYVCGQCGHLVTADDIVLDPGERLAYGATIGLGYVMGVALDTMT